MEKLATSVSQKAAGLPLNNITQELDALLSDGAASKEKDQDVRNGPAAETTSVFRADAPAFVPQSKLRADAPTFTPPMSCAPDPAIAGNGLAAALPAGLVAQPRKSPGLTAAQLLARGPGLLQTQPSASPNGQPSGDHLASDQEAKVQLFEEQWSAGAVPDALKELWVPPSMQNTGLTNPALALPTSLTSNRNIFSTAPPKSPPSYPQSPSSYPQPPPAMYPYESPLLTAAHPGQDALKALWTPSTAVPDSPANLGSPTAVQLLQYRLPPLAPPSQIPLPVPPPPQAPVPTVDYMFSMRELLLKFRTSMGEVQPPWELKLRYKLIDEREVIPPPPPPPDDSIAMPPSPQAGAGATLLAFVKGNASKSEVVGKARGAELLQMLNAADDAEGSGSSPIKAVGNENVQRLLGLATPSSTPQKENNGYNGSGGDWEHRKHGMNDGDPWSWSGNGHGGNNGKGWSHWNEDRPKGRWSGAGRWTGSSNPKGRWP